MSAVANQIVDRFFRENGKRIKKWIDDFEMFNGHQPTFGDFYKYFPVTEDREKVTVKVFVEELLDFLNIGEFVTLDIKQKMMMHFVGYLMTKGEEENGNEPVGAAGVHGSPARTA